MHDPSVGDSDHFTFLQSMKGDPNAQLAHLKSICEKRLSQPKDSAYRMEYACSQVPEHFPGND